MERLAKSFECQVAKVDSDHGVVFGFAAICLKNGERHFDLQQEHIPESTMFDMSVDFMRNSRVAKAMHNGEQIGEVLFAFPLTTEVAKALQITTEKTGLLIGMAPGAEGLKKFADGTYTGFSIGGTASYVDDEETK